MIVKSKDSLDSELADLEHALQGRGLPAFKRRNTERRLAQIRSGIWGEKEAAYHIDFHLKDSLNWTVIHDLRIEWKGRVAQIDHLILGRCLDAYVVESKNFTTKVRHANGGWERLVFSDWEGIPCPVEQNERHIHVLKALIEDRNLAPTRLGIPLPVTFFNVVVVAPSCSIVGKFPGNARVYRMDKLMDQISKLNASPFSLLKVVAPETLHEMGRKLAACHTPIAGKEKIHPIVSNKMASATLKKLENQCETCSGMISPAEKTFCRLNQGRFGGKLLCLNCQKFAPKATASKDPPVCCAECGARLEAKVIEYCECNPAQFANRILCRKCQGRFKTTAV